LKTFGIIPARYASTRFPGKPLAKIQGKTMIERVYQQASKAFEIVAVATDDERIVQEVKRFGGTVVMTSPSHNSGTDRCAEALVLLQEMYGENPEVVVNIQGDEPFVDPGLLRRLAECFEESSVQIATVVRTFDHINDLLNPNNVKAVITPSAHALYFSRSVVPYVRGYKQEEWLNQQTFYWHLGLYAYRTEALRQLTQLAQSPLEIAESLEQNRWLENDFYIKVIQTDQETIAIDTPDDLEAACKWLTENAKI
jgi:3-deoxy-manno-octulosonate cytidylyltransferase (CMP-KDO synthetase)